VQTEKHDSTLRLRCYIRTTGGTNTESENIVGPAGQPAEEYRVPELIVHGDVAKLTAGSALGTTDVGGQTASALPGPTPTP
jgi:hypothetical protein